MSEGQATRFSRGEVRITVLRILSQIMAVEEAGIADDMYILKERGSPNLGGDEDDIKHILLGFGDFFHIRLCDDDYDKVYSMTVGRLIDFVAGRC